MEHLAKAMIGAALAVALWVWIGRGSGSECQVSYVFDGDTVAMICGGVEIRARIVGLDTPEGRGARCDAERAASDAATLRMRALIAGADQIGIVRRGHDKYGRDLIRLRVDGRDVARTMIEEGLAVAYDGGKRPDWCARLARGED